MVRPPNAGGSDSLPAADVASSFFGCPLFFISRIDVVRRRRRIIAGDSAACVNELSNAGFEKGLRNRAGIFASISPIVAIDSGVNASIVTRDFEKNIPRAIIVKWRSEAHGAAREPVPRALVSIIDVSSYHRRVGQARRVCDRPYSRSRSQRNARASQTACVNIDASAIANFCAAHGGTTADRRNNPP